MIHDKVIKYIINENCNKIFIIGNKFVFISVTTFCNFVTFYTYNGGLKQFTQFNENFTFYLFYAQN